MASRAGQLLLQEFKNTIPWSSEKTELPGSWGWEVVLDYVYRVERATHIFVAHEKVGVCKNIGALMALFDKPVAVRVAADELQPSKRPSRSTAKRKPKAKRSRPRSK